MKIGNSRLTGFLVLLGTLAGGCSRHENSRELSSLESAYQAGVITKGEYAAKKAALESKAALEAAQKAGLLTPEEYREKKMRLDGIPATAVAPETSSMTGEFRAIAKPLADTRGPDRSPDGEGGVLVKGAETPGPSTNSPPRAIPQSFAPPIVKSRFRVQSVFDSTLGGMLAYRFAVPQDWKATGGTVWNYRDLYGPSRTHTRAEAPDGSAWYEGYPQELFYWGDHDTTPVGNSTFGGIHHRNITAQEAMARYVIGRYRGRAANLHILGYRPVSNLAQALNVTGVQGEGICFRIRYDIDNQPVDEEFYGLMSPVYKIPYTGPQGTWYEFHRALMLLHSFGAKGGKLESLRPLLGAIGPSTRNDPAWLKRSQDISDQISSEYFRQLKVANDAGAAAVAMSRVISANNDQMIRDMDSRRAAGNAASRASTASAAPGSHGSSFERQADDYDQYVRGTEHVVDSSGEVSDQPNQYNYHWTDGYGNFIHSNDASYDPNTQSNQHYELTKKK